MSSARDLVLARIRRKAKSFERIEYDSDTVKAAVAIALKQLDTLPSKNSNNAEYSIELELILRNLSKELKRIDRGVVVTARWHDEEAANTIQDLCIVGIEIKWSREARGKDIPQTELFTIDRMFLEGFL